MTRGVLQIVHSLEFGGMERVAINLVRHLDPARYRPMACCIACKGDFAPELEEAGFPVFCLDKGPGVSLAAPRRLAELIRRERVEILHMHNSGPLFTGTLAGIATRVPVRVYTDHARKFPDRPRVMWTETALVRAVHRIVAVSEETRQNLARFLRAPQKKLRVIPNGVEAPRPVPEERRLAVRREFGIAPDDPLVVTLARLEPQKAIHRLIDAAAIVRQELPRARFLVAGGGAMEAELRQRVRDLHLEGVFHLAGWRLDIAEILAAGDVFALSSDWEGMPMSLLEALALEKPAVCPDVGDVRKEILHGQTGFIVQPGSAPALAEALARLLADPALARAMGRRGRALFEERFDVRTMTRQYEELYEEILSGAR